MPPEPRCHVSPAPSSHHMNSGMRVMPCSLSEVDSTHMSCSMISGGHGTCKMGEKLLVEQFWQSSERTVEIFLQSCRAFGGRCGHVGLQLRQGMTMSSVPSAMSRQDFNVIFDLQLRRRP